MNKNKCSVCGIDANSTIEIFSEYTKVKQDYYLCEKCENVKDILQKGITTYYPIQFPFRRKKLIPEEYFLLVNTKQHLKKILDKCRKEDLDDILRNLLPVRKNYCVLSVDYGLEYKRELRSFFIYRFHSWCPPPFYGVLEQIEDFIGEDKVLEVGAGAGLIGKLLECMGINIVCTDISKKDEAPDYSYPKSQKDKKIFNYLPVVSMDATKAIKTYPNCNVIMNIWGRGFLNENIEYFKGNKAIIIGEALGGCTHSAFDLLTERDSFEKGSDLFHISNVILKDWKLEKNIKTRNFDGAFTEVFLYSKL